MPLVIMHFMIMQFVIVRLVIVVPAASAYLALGTSMAVSAGSSATTAPSNSGVMASPAHGRHNTRSACSTPRGKE